MLGWPIYCLHNHMVVFSLDLLRACMVLRFVRLQIFKSLKVTNELLWFQVNHIREKTAKGLVIFFSWIPGSTCNLSLIFVWWCGASVFECRKLLLVICINLIQWTTLVSMPWLSLKRSIKKLIVLSLLWLCWNLLLPTKIIIMTIINNHSLHVHSILSRSQNQRELGLKKQKQKQETSFKFLIGHQLVLI